MNGSHVTEFCNRPTGGHLFSSIRWTSARQRRVGLRNSPLRPLHKHTGLDLYFSTVQNRSRCLVRLRLIPNHEALEVSGRSHQGGVCAVKL